MNNLIFGAAALIAALAGGAAAAIFPSAQLTQAASHVTNGDYSVADLNPIRAAYDTVKTKIQIGSTPEQLGFHASPPLDFKMPDPSTWQGVGSSLTPGIQNAWGQSAAAQTTQFNNRMEDIRNYSRNPAGWHGAPPF